MTHGSAAQPDDISVGRRGLRRSVLSIPELAGTGIAQVAPAIAIFFVFGSIVAVSGVGTPFVILLAAIGYLFHVNSTAEFNRKVPSAGFYVTYIARAFGNASGGQQRSYLLLLRSRSERQFSIR